MADLSSRYARNRASLSAEEQERLQASRVLVLGCGGLGGSVIEALARIGVGAITVCDGDVFDATNLNRQILCTEADLGRKKAEAAAERVAAVNSGVAVTVFADYVTDENIGRLMGVADVAIDALDSARARRLAARAAAEAGIPLIHGAIAGWNARVRTILPGDDAMEFLCASGDSGAEKLFGCLPFTAMLCAALQAAEAVKYLLKRGEAASDRLIECDLEHLDFDSIPLA